MLSPSADCCENGAFTAIRSVRSVPFEWPPQPAEARTAASAAAARASLISPRMYSDRLAPEVGSAHVGVAADLCRRALRNRTARIEHGHAVGDRADETQVVLDDEQADAAVAQAQDRVGEEWQLVRAAARRRLV